MGGFTIDVPEGFEVEEMVGTRIEFRKNGELIFTNRNTTNFDNLKDYLNNLDDLNKAIVLEENYMQIASFDAVKRTYKFSSEETQISYIIFVDGYLYRFSTNNLSLETSLDYIALSFHIPKE